ncbi:hypothetical protein [Polaromonas sp. YR568]|uniref:hypothetical protein n=1 Tax=Polaromonas sp. YR568 TaxID=1855301 RepID=UPI00398C04D9
MTARLGLLLACCLGLAACAGPGGHGADDLQPPFRDKALTMQSAQGMLIAGTSTKADVAAALGPAAVVRFDSGYEVWAYREKPPRSTAPGAEFVILFTPSGVVQKTRIRPRYALRAQ